MVISAIIPVVSQVFFREKLIKNLCRCLVRIAPYLLDASPWCVNHAVSIIERALSPPVSKASTFPTPTVDLAIRFKTILRRSVASSEVVRPTRETRRPSPGWSCVRRWIASGRKSGTRAKRIPRDRQRLALGPFRHHRVGIMRNISDKVWRTV